MGGERYIALATGECNILGVTGEEQMGAFGEQKTLEFLG